MNETTPEQLEAEIVRVAHEHGGRFLLPRRYGRQLPWLEPDEIDLQYEACERLVARREARWLTSHLAPGVEILK